MFFWLGLRNAWGNRGRTVLGVASMAVAALVFMSGATLSRGYPAQAYFEARQLLGADLLLLPGKTVMSREDLAGADYVWRFVRKSLDRPDATLGFDAGPFSYGILQGLPVSQVKGVSEDRYREVLSLLRKEPSIKSATLKQSIPFLMPVTTSLGLSYCYGFLEARDIAEDIATWKMDQAVRSGKYLDPGDERGMSGIACAGWAGMRVFTFGMPELEVPRCRGRLESGLWVLDYADPLRAELRIRGAAYFIDSTSSRYSDPVIFVSRGTFAEIARRAGFPDAATYWGIGAAVKDMSELEDVIALLRRQYPDFTVIGVPYLAAAAGTQSGVPAGIPVDVREVTEALVFITAALLSAANLAVLMVSRKNEIGILRALGATRWNIACMVLSETMSIALIGAIAGSLLVQPAILWGLVSNKVPLAAAAERIGVPTARAVSFSLLSAASFGFLPVMRALKFTPAQVLRGE